MSASFPEDEPYRGRRKVKSQNTFLRASLATMLVSFNVSIKEKGFGSQGPKHVKKVMIVGHHYLIAFLPIKLIKSIRIPFLTEFSYRQKSLGLPSPGSRELG